jgi:hypothetical protein
MFAELPQTMNGNIKAKYDQYNILLGRWWLLNGSRRPFGGNACRTLLLIACR